jgi:hypothetical protein
MPVLLDQGDKVPNTVPNGSAVCFRTNRDWRRGLPHASSTQRGYIQCNTLREFPSFPRESQPGTPVLLPMASIVAALVRVMTSQPRFFFHALTLEEVRSVFLALSLAIVPTGALAVWFQRDGAAAASWLRGGAIALPLVALYRFVPTWWRRRRRAAAWRQDMVGLVAVVTGRAPMVTWACTRRRSWCAVVPPSSWRVAT